jgi:hypothetical protein
MPTTYTSPFASSFKSAVKRGTSYTTAVENIAKRCNKSTNVVWNSLYKAGLCYRQKFNGQWIYWPCNGHKTNSTNWKMSQTHFWQFYCEWCIANGCCTPEQLKNHCGSQKEFMTWCRKFFGKQYTWSTTSCLRRQPRNETFERRPSGRRFFFRGGAATCILRETGNSPLLIEVLFAEEAEVLLPQDLPREDVVVHGQGDRGRSARPEQQRVGEADVELRPEEAEAHPRERLVLGELDHEQVEHGEGDAVLAEELLGGGAVVGDETHDGVIRRLEHAQAAEVQVRRLVEHADQLEQPPDLVLEEDAELSDAGRGVSL